MVEELEEVLRKFVLSEKETNGIQIEGTDAIQGLAECRKSIIGKVAGDKVANLAGMTSFTNNMWTFAKNLIVVEIGVNLFQFTLASLHDRDRVLDGSP